MKMGMMTTKSLEIKRS